MTTLAAYHKPGWGTAIASDSQFGTTQFKDHLKHSKWLTANGWAIGVAGRYVMMLYIEKHLEEITQHCADAFNLGQRIIKVLEAYKWGSDSEEFADGELAPQSYSANILVANGNGVWQLTPEMVPHPSVSNEIVAGGSGFYYATAAGYTLRHEKNPIRLVAKAIECASRFDPGTSGFIWTLRLMPEKTVATARSKCNK